MIKKLLTSTLSIQAITITAACLIFWYMVLLWLPTAMKNADDCLYEGYGESKTMVTWPMHGYCVHPVTGHVRMIETLEVNM